MEILHGTGACPGVALGIGHVITRAKAIIGDVSDPSAAFSAGVEAVVRDYEHLANQAMEAGRDEAAAVLSAQAMMAEDPMLLEAVEEGLSSGLRLQVAIESAGDSLSSMLAALDDPYLAARAPDVLEASGRIVNKIAGVDTDVLAGLTEPCVIIAPTLTAAETSQLDPSIILGFVTEEGGATSHVAVIARSLDIPAVVGVQGATGRIPQGASVAIDGMTGELVVDPDPTTRNEFLQRQGRHKEHREVADRMKGVSVTYDGKPFAVPANVGGPEDVERAVEAGADGIGLYRTEVLFLDRSAPPTEEEQEAIYRSALAAFDEPVVVRTLDIGGDKPASYLDTPMEENPFLGERGVRLYKEFSVLFRGQVRALLRASTQGDLWIMIPMIATVDDLLETKATILDERRQLEDAGVDVGDVKIGVMIEVPSAAVISDRLAKHADFFSIGTNDLTQYTMAADRMNGRLSAYSDAAHPAVLGLCNLTAQGAAKTGIPVSVCGEAAADPVLGTIFAAMGITKLSVSAPSVNLVKARIAGADVDHCRSVLEAALSSEDAASVRALGT